MGITRLLVPVVAGVLFDVEATDASLSFDDSPGEALRFLRFLRGLPFSFGAGKLYEDVEHHRDRNINKFTYIHFICEMKREPIPGRFNMFQIISRIDR